MSPHKPDGTSGGVDKLFEPENLRRNWERPKAAENGGSEESGEQVDRKPVTLSEHCVELRRLVTNRFHGDNFDGIAVILEKIEALAEQEESEERNAEIYTYLNHVEDLVEAFTRTYPE